MTVCKPIDKERNKWRMIYNRKSFVKKQGCNGLKIEIKKHRIKWYETPYNMKRKHRNPTWKIPRIRFTVLLYSKK